MPFISLNKAIGSALLGVDVTSAALGSSDLGGPGRGFKTAAFDAQRGNTAKSQTLLGRRQISFNGVKTEIPVYRLSARGRRIIETWPSLSFNLVNFQFAPQRYIWRADQFRDPVLTSFKAVSDTAVGPTLSRVRDNPEPYDVMFEIRIWSKDQFESYAINRVVLETFPARGALKAIQQNGVVKLWEMALQSVVCADDNEPTLEDSDRAAFSWIYTYVVETFLDNTEVFELKQTITQPEFNLETM